MPLAEWLPIFNLISRQPHLKKIRRDQSHNLLPAKFKQIVTQSFTQWSVSHTIYRVIRSVRLFTTYSLSAHRACKSSLIYDASVHRACVCMRVSDISDKKKGKIIFMDKSSFIKLFFSCKMINTNCIPFKSLGSVRWFSSAIILLFGKDALNFSTVMIKTLEITISNKCCSGSGSNNHEKKPVSQFHKNIKGVVRFSKNFCW